MNLESGSQDPSSGQNDATRRQRRLLIPINAKEDSRWGISYALELHEKGHDLEVCLLHIGETITEWQVLRFRTQVEIAKFQAERAEAFFNEASEPIAQKNMRYRRIFKQGDVVFTILDTAEELACDEIVLPAQTSGLFKVFSNGIVASVLRRQRAAKIILVDRHGVVSTI